ncbi:MAG: c-type cytochrome [Verrucomicrobiota bacterium]
MSNETNQDINEGPVLRKHVYDGIEEYDQKLPNWWLFTLWITVVFFIFYWLGFYGFDLLKTDQERLDPKIAALRTQEREAMLAMLDDENLWKMSRQKGPTSAVIAGKQIYNQNCMACHGPNLGGTSEGVQYIGLDLADNDWKYGGKPSYVYQTVFNGSPDPTKGMVAWGPLLGAEKAAQVVAFVLSKQSTMPTQEPVETPAVAPTATGVGTPEATELPEVEGENPEVQHLMAVGQTTYNTFCIACHGPDGKGIVANLAPPLVSSSLATGPNERLSMLILNGIQPEGKFTGVMVSWKNSLSDEQIAGVSTYIRNQFGNSAAPVFTEQIAHAREKYKAISTPHRRAELETITTDLPKK